jgi:GT2 family glycosyltransferase
VLRSVRRLMTQLCKKSLFVDKLGRILGLGVLVLKNREARRFIRGLLYYLSHLDELPPSQFFVNLVSWSRDLAAWQGNTIERKRREMTILRYQPKITVITPIFGSGGGSIKETLRSVNRQCYQNWELYLLVDKQSQLQLSRLINDIFDKNQEVEIKYKSDFDLNLDSALNEVLNECKGEFVGFLSGSDTLTRNGLYEIVNLLNQYPDADIIYSDEAEENREILIHLFYKPNWSQDLFLSMNYLRNFLCCRTDIIQTVGGFRGYFEDDIKYDLILRIIEGKERIYHIPKILYHEQVPKSSYPKGFTADYCFELYKRALQEHIERVGIQGKVCDGIFKGSFRVHRRILGQPKVSIIIPTKDNSDQLKRCLESIESKTTYRNFEIIIVDNASTELEMIQYLESSPHKVIQYAEKFNFSKINNLASRHATGEYLLFLNDDTQVISPEWLEAMLEHAQRREVGIIGAKLLYPNGLIQHAGMLLQRRRGVHMHRFLNYYDHGYYGMADVVRNFNVVTGACLMIRRNVFEEVGGFEEDFAILCNDADLCLKVRSRGYLIVYTPYALLYHFEGMSRWSDLRKEAEAIDFLYSKWKVFIDNDTYFTPNCSSSSKSIFWADAFVNYDNTS